MSDRFSFQQDLQRDSWGMAVSLGLIDGITVREVTGYNDDIAGPVESIWGAGGTITYGIAPVADQAINGAIYSVPADKKGWISRAQNSLNRSGNPDSYAIIRYKLKPFGAAELKTTRFSLSKRGTSEFEAHAYQSIALEPRTDIIVEASSDAANTDVTAAFTLVLADLGLVD